MYCRHYELAAAGCDSGFTVDASRVTFGNGVLGEVGERARASGIKRAAVFTDPVVRAQPWFAEVPASLAKAGVDAAIYDAITIEPTDASFEDAGRFAKGFDGLISVGGGSVMDTCKAAALLATYPAPLRTYLNSPVGDARPIPGPLPPHLACPTTSGTGSEVTGFAICTWSPLHAKTAIASPRLRPTEAIVDPRVALTQPSSVVAASGMDVLCHAVESYTARRYHQRPSTGIARPLSQGANPWSDVGCREALRLIDLHLVAAVQGDPGAREQMMWAATLAGIAFGNAGVHVPHAMAYAIGGGPAVHGGGGVRAFRPAGYPDAPLVPHGMAVALAAPSVFRFTAATSPARHVEAATLLGAKAHDAHSDHGGELLAMRVAELMKQIGMPNGIAEVGYAASDIPALVEGVMPQQRLLTNAPCEITRDTLAELFAGSERYW